MIIHTAAFVRRVAAIIPANIRRWTAESIVPGADTIATTIDRANRLVSGTAEFFPPAGAITAGVVATLRLTVGTAIGTADARSRRTADAGGRAGAITATIIAKHTAARCGRNPGLRGFEYIDRHGGGKRGGLRGKSRRARIPSPSGIGIMQNRSGGCNSPDTQKCFEGSPPACTRCKPFRQTVELPIVH